MLPSIVSIVLLRSCVMRIISIIQLIIQLQQCNITSIAQLRDVMHNSKQYTCSYNNVTSRASISVIVIVTIICTHSRLHNDTNRPIGWCIPMSAPSVSAPSMSAPSISAPGMSAPCMSAPSVSTLWHANRY